MLSSAGIPWISTPPSHLSTYVVTASFAFQSLSHSVYKLVLKTPLKCYCLLGITECNLQHISAVSSLVSPSNSVHKSVLKTQSDTWMLNGANAATNDFVDMWSQKTWLLMTLIVNMWTQKRKCLANSLPRHYQQVVTTLPVGELVGWAASCNDASGELELPLTTKPQGELVGWGASYNNVSGELVGWAPSNNNASYLTGQTPCRYFNYHTCMWCQVSNGWRKKWKPTGRQVVSLSS